MKSEMVKHLRKPRVTQRWTIAKDLKLCFRCLRDNHFGSNCRSAARCSINNCMKTHNQWLHTSFENQRVNESSLNPEATEYKRQDTTGHNRVNFASMTSEL